MDKLTNEQFNRIKNWMYRNARPLEMARWKYHFENGSREDVVNSLMAYQNDDGGFGNAIEPDSWNPNSSPIAATYVIGILEEIGFNDKNHTIIKNILRYLDETSEFTGEYWPAVIKSNNDYQHAPWWTFGGDIEYDWGYNPTAKLAGFILRFAGKDSSIYAKAEKIAKAAINTYLNGVASDGRPYRSVDREGEIDCLHYLVQCLLEADLHEAYNTSGMEAALGEQVGKFIERDTSKWNQYCRKPSVYITSPESIFYEGNEEVMNNELSYILNNRNQDGVWNIVWAWGAYDKEFAVSENWWKAIIVIWNMLLLKNFNCL